MIKSLQNRSVNARGDANGRKESESRFIRSKVDRLIRNHTALTSSDHDDFVQECELHLFEYRDRFDPIRSSYQTFVNRILENKLKSLVRARVAQMRDFRRNAHSLNATICDADGDSVETARTLDELAARHHTGQSARSDEEQTRLRLDTAEVLKALPDDLRPLAELLQEMTEYAASRAAPESRRQVKNKVTRLRERFEDADLRDYL